jgi:hypothetical protein
MFEKHADGLEAFLEGGSMLEQANGSQVTCNEMGQVKGIGCMAPSQQKGGHAQVRK